MGDGSTGNAAAQREPGVRGFGLLWMLKSLVMIERKRRSDSATRSPGHR